MNAVLDRTGERDQLDPLWEMEPGDSDGPAPVATPQSARTNRAPERSNPSSVHISGQLAAVVAVAWVGILAAIYVLEPEPTNPDAAIPMWEAMAAFAFVWAIPAIMVGLARRQRWGLRLSALGAGLGLTLAGGCLQTGHHSGMFPFAEMAAMAFLAGLSWVALRRIHVRA